LVDKIKNPNKTNSQDETPSKNSQDQPNNSVENQLDE
jgi:hypothetical protein